MCLLKKKDIFYTLNFQVNLWTLAHPQEIVAKTTIEYSQASSLHGIQYIFEGGKNLQASRIIWLALACAAFVIGSIWSVEVSWDLIVVQCGSLSFSVSQQAYVEWQQNPTMNSLLTTGLPIADIDFPAITICGHGSINEVTYS